MLAIAMNACFFFSWEKKYAMKSLKFYPDTAVQSSIKKEWRVKRSRYRKEKYGWQINWSFWLLLLLLGPCQFCFCRMNRTSTIPDKPVPSGVYTRGTLSIFPFIVFNFRLIIGVLLTASNDRILFLPTRSEGSPLWLSIP